MPYRLFQFPVPGPSDLSDLNSFLSQHRIVATSQQIVQTGNTAMLVFVIEYVSNQTKANPTEAKNSPKVDYREVLSDVEFEMFSRLRDERKKLAETAGVPVYTVFNNAQLAEMVQKKIQTASDLKAIEGVGQAKLERYGKPFLEILTTEFPKKDAE